VIIDGTKKFLYNKRRMMMTRKEFDEWIYTCPTHKAEILWDEDGYVQVQFPIQQEENDNE